MAHEHLEHGVVALVTSSAPRHCGGNNVAVGATAEAVGTDACNCTVAMVMAMAQTLSGATMHAPVTA